MSSRTNEKQRRSTSSRVPSAAEKVADIEELLSQILLALPHRPLYRFKCVCKHWFSLITGFYHPKLSCFISKKINQEHFKFIPLIPKLEKTSPTWNPFKSVNEDQFKYIPLLRKSWFDLGNSLDRSLEIIQSCNGLFLCHDGYGSSNVYVVNPTTNQFLGLSSPSVEKCSWGRFIRYGLAFEPSKCPHYKVVCVSHYIWPPIKDHCIDIYSSETRQWKRLKTTPFFPSPSDEHRHRNLKKRPMHFDNRSSESPVFCNGAIHWMRSQCERAALPFRTITSRDGKRLFRGFEREEWDVLHFFDVDKELFKLATATPPLPLAVKNIPLDGDSRPTMFPRLVHSYFGESGGGRLHLIEVYEHSRTQFEVMEMEKDYTAWVVKYSVDLNSVFTAFPQHDSSAVVVLSLFPEKEIRDNEEEGSLCLLLHMPGKVISYNLMKKTFNISIEFTNKKLFLGSYTYPYMESLAPV